MWEALPINQKEIYKKYILSLASLTKMFAQKSTDKQSNLIPFVSSKFQESSFRKAFDAKVEDIGNTSYDISLRIDNEKYLIGIKTFAFSAGDQKIAQFKSKYNDWSEIINRMNVNAKGVGDRETINNRNGKLYKALALKIAKLRNMRIESARANIKGFECEVNDERIHSIYHVLMPANEGNNPKIYVGELSYDEIDIDNLSVIGCTSVNNPSNFLFTDNKHIYKFTSADSQLFMNFDVKNIICDEWSVRFLDNAENVFAKIADSIYPSSNNLCDSYPIVLKEGESENYINAIAKANNIEINTQNKQEIEESFCWTIWNSNKEVELFSGFNNFYGIGSKLGVSQRKQKN